VARLRELIQYRELVRNLVVRDLKVRYKNSVLGFLWSLLNPLMMMVIFTVVFTIMLPNNTIDRFPVFVLCALLPWNFFSSSVMTSVHSVVGSAHLIKKVYFPREVLPLSTVLANLANFLLAMIVLFGMMFVFRTPLTVWTLLLPVIVLVQVIFTLGLAFLSLHAQCLLSGYGGNNGRGHAGVVFPDAGLLPHHYFASLPDSIWICTGHSTPGLYFEPHGLIIASYRVILYYGAPPAFDFLARTVVTSFALLSLGYLVFVRYSKIFAEQL